MALKSILCFHPHKNIWDGFMSVIKKENWHRNSLHIYYPPGVVMS